MRKITGDYFGMLLAPGFQANRGFGKPNTNPSCVKIRPKHFLIRIRKLRGQYRTGAREEDSKGRKLRERERTVKDGS